MVVRLEASSVARAAHLAPVDETISMQMPQRKETPLAIPVGLTRSKEWNNYVLFKAVRAVDYPEYFILSYIIAKPEGERATPVDMAGFREIKEPVMLMGVKQYYLGLN